MMLDWKAMALGATIGALGASALYAAVPEALPKDRAAMEALVRDYILAHPEIVSEAIEKGQAAEQAKLVATNRRALETPYPGAWTGNPSGDVTLVEFYDYACGYCRTSVKDVDRLVAEDKNLRVVFRELPILSVDSEAAARASLAAAKAGTFMAFHRAMFATGRLDPETVSAVQRRTRSPAPAQIDPNHDRELTGNIALARALSLTGTPSFIVGGQIFNGAVGYDQLKAAIAEARKPS